MKLSAAIALAFLDKGYPPEVRGNAMNPRDGETADGGPTGWGKLGTWLADPKVQSALLLLLFFVGVTPLKLDFVSVSFEPTPDGGFYTQVAENVRDGKGLVSNLSWYQQGYPYFPHPTSIYPIWPLVYGVVGQFGPMIQAGSWFNFGLYYVALTFGYLWARNAFRGPIVPALSKSLNAGHLFVLVLGLNPHFIKVTSTPYTEALAYTFLLLFLWVGHKRWQTPSIKSGLVIGLFTGLIFLTRYQLILVLIAAVCTIIWALLVHRDRGPILRLALGLVSGFAIFTGPFFIYVGGFLEGGLTTLFPFSKGRVTDILSVHDMKHKGEGKGLQAVVLDRLKGFTVAWHAKSKSSFRMIYGDTALSVLFAVPYVIGFGLLAVIRKQAGELWEWSRTRESLPYIFVFIFALGGFFHLFLIHKGFSHPWYFSKRQGLPAVFLIFMCLLWLFRARLPGSVLIAVFLLTTGANYSWHASHRTQELFQKSQLREFPNLRVGVDPAQVKVANLRSKYDRLSSWLQKQRDSREKLTVVMGGPWRYGYRTDDIGFHSYSPSSTPDDIRLMFDELDADILLVAGRERKKRWYRNTDFRKFFKKTKTVVQGHTVYLRRGKESSFDVPSESSSESSSESPSTEDSKSESVKEKAIGVMRRRHESSDDSFDDTHGAWGFVEIPAEGPIRESDSEDSA